MAINRFPAGKPSGRQRTAARRKGSQARKGNMEQAGKLPRNQPEIELVIDRLGGRGDGLGTARLTMDHIAADETIIVPASLPGEQVKVRPLQRTGNGIRAELLELLTVSDQRAEADCGAFPECGGCQLRHMTEPAYRSWKQDRLAELLARAGLEPGEIRPAYFAGPASRRRARFSARQLASGVVLGFQQRFSNHIVTPDNCQILHPRLAGLLPALAGIAASLLPVGAQLSIEANLLDHGADILLASETGLSAPNLARLPEMAASAGLARLSIAQNNGPALTLYAPQPALLSWPGRSGQTIAICPPPGAFLQASIEAEQIMQSEITGWLDGASRIADLFAGCGTFSLPLLDRTRTMLAVDLPGPALDALQDAANQAGLGNQLTTIGRDLASAPLSADELAEFDAVIMDPPRQGGRAQTHMLAKAQIGQIMMVSCNPYSFVGDAACLTEAGYRFDWLKLIDQFDRASHSELLAGFTYAGPDKKTGQRDGILI